MATFKVGDKVRIVHPSRGKVMRHVGMVGFITKPGSGGPAYLYNGRGWEWVVDVAIPLHEVTQIRPSEINVMSEQLEHVLDGEGVDADEWATAQVMLLLAPNPELVKAEA